jgi:hypothetical protein
MPEVSALDFSNAITLNGFRVPAISTRRTETEVELRDGQTFAIAGLIDNSVTQTMSKVPGLGDIPILGLLFKSRAYQKNATELVVMITPQILRRDSVGVTGDLPRMPQPFLPYEQKTLPPPAPAFSTPEARSVAPVGDAAAEAGSLMTPNAVAPGMPEAPAPSKADLKAVEHAKADEAKRAREAEKEEAARLEREAREAERVAKIAEQQAKKQAEIDRKAALRQAEIDREEAKKAEAAAIEEAKRQAVLDRQQAELDRKREAEERKQAERDRKEQEKLEKERERLERERLERGAEEAAIAQKLEQMRIDAERRKEEERREEQERIQKERAKRDPWPRLRSRI